MKKRIISFVLVAVTVMAMFPLVTVSTVALDIVDDQANSRVMEKVDSATLDGINTEGEYDSARRVFLNGAGNALTLVDMGDAMRVIYTDEAIYVLVEIIDDTVNGFNCEDDVESFDFIKLYFKIGDTFVGSEDFCRGNADGVIPENSVFNETEFGFSLEMRFPTSELSDEEKEAYADRNLNVGFSAYVQDGETKTWQGDIDNSGFGDIESYASKLPLYTFSYIDENHKNYMLYDPDPVLDGINTSGEYNEAYVTKIDKFGYGDTDTEGDIFRVVYSNDAIYVLIESADNTNDGNNDYIDFYFKVGSTYVGRKQVYRNNPAGENQNYGGLFSFGGSWYHNTEYFAHTNSENGFTLEAKFSVNNMSETDKASFKNGTLYVGFSVCIKNASATRSDHRNNELFSSGNPYVSQYPRFTFEDKIITPRLLGASLSLGKHIDLNYIVNLSNEDADGARMVFDYNGNEYVIRPKKISGNRYKFVFRIGGPQNFCENIYATFFVNGKTVAIKSEYSIRTYCENILGTKGEYLDQLIYDFLAYGAAAQLSVNKDIDNLANAGYEDKATVISEIENDDRVIGKANLAGAKFSAAGVYHSNTNNIYVKISVNGEDESTLDVKIDGVSAKIERVEDAANVLIVYTEDINVLDFDKVYHFELTDGSNVQTLTYSINAYAKTKFDNSKTDAASNLAKALYAYGISAENYMADIFWEK